MRQEIFIFVKEEEHESVENFGGAEFLIKLAYLSNVVDKLNSLNLQSKDIHILNLTEKI